MLPKERRISKLLFKKILTNKGFFVKDDFFTLRYIKDTTLKKSRFAVSVSKKKIATAVKRNKGRRMSYGALSRVLENIKPGFYGIFTLEKTLSTLSQKEVEEHITKTLKKAEII